MKRLISTSVIVLTISVVLVLSVTVNAGGPQQKATAATTSSTKPGRDPNQPIDEEYTRKIREYTTEPFFLSPLVDYLPASATVPTPKAVLEKAAQATSK